MQAKLLKFFIETQLNSVCDFLWPFLSCLLFSSFQPSEKAKNKNPVRREREHAGGIPVRLDSRCRQKSEVAAPSICRLSEYDLTWEPADVCYK